MYLAELRNKESVQEKVDIKFCCEYDVVVAGLGTAGAIAAISAGENGAKVLGVEKLTLAGGSATAGGIAGYYYGLEGGRFEKVDAEAAKIRENSFIKGGCFHHDAKAIALDNQLTEAGVKVLYQSSVIGVFLGDQNNIAGVRLVTPDGVKNVGCKALLDASGDGEVCAMAGAEYAEGRLLDGQSQPFSSVRIFQQKDYITWANFDAGYATASDGKDMSRAIIDSNALHMVPAGERMNELLWITTIPGIRECRLIKCDETLTFPDFLNGKRFDNPVAYCYSNFDSHSKDWAFEEDLIKDWMVGASLWGKNMVFPVPFECMVVTGFKNLLAVGRCLSVDHEVACALRMQRCMQKLGQAAGTAAAMAVKNNCEIREIDFDGLRDLLRKDGCLADPEMADWEVPENAEKLVEIIQSNKPGEAIWYLSRNIEKYESDLNSWLGSSDQHLSRNSALVLGIAGRKSALPILRETILNRDDFCQETSRSQNQKRILGAIHLLGKIPEDENIEVLLGYLSAELNLHEFSHTMMSLLRLGDTFPARQKEIAGKLICLMESSAFTYKLVMKNSSSTGLEVFEPMGNYMRLLAARKFKEWGIENRLAEIPEKGMTWRERRLSKEIAG